MSGEEAGTTGRLSVNINAESAQILRIVMADRDWTATEAVRVALGLLSYMEVARRMMDKEETSE